MMNAPDTRLIGYARVSTDDQDLSLQLAALRRYGVPDHAIYREHASGRTMKRKELSRALRPLHPGDTFVVWKLDRLGRTLVGVLEVLEQIQKQGVHFVSLTESWDTSTPMGNAMLQVALVFAELERKMISERTKAGIMEAKKRGQRFGQPNRITDVQKRIAYLRRLDKAGKLRDEDNDLQMTAEDLRLALNRAAPEAREIGSVETVRRWVRQGYPSLAAPDLVEDEPLDFKEG